MTDQNEKRHPFSREALAQPVPVMDLHDWFAGQALAGLLASPVAFGVYFQGNHDAIAEECRKFASAMLAARGEP